MNFFQIYRGDFNAELDHIFGIVYRSPHLVSYEMRPIRYNEGLFTGQTIIPIRIPRETIDGIWINADDCIYNVRINNNTFHNIRNNYAVTNVLSRLVGKRIIYSL